MKEDWPPPTAHQPRPKCARWEVLFLGPGFPSRLFLNRGVVPPPPVRTPRLRECYPRAGTPINSIVGACVETILGSQLLEAIPGLPRILCLAGGSATGCTWMGLLDAIYGLPWMLFLGGGLQFRLHAPRAHAPTIRTFSTPHVETYGHSPFGPTSHPTRQSIHVLAISAYPLDCAFAPALAFVQFTTARRNGGCTHPTP